jgi:hypothetical protein
VFQPRRRFGYGRRLAADSATPAADLDGCYMESIWRRRYVSLAVRDRADPGDGAMANQDLVRTLHTGDIDV